MIKARLDSRATPGKHVVLLGLSLENTRRLHQGNGIQFSLTEMGLPDIDICIIAGDDEEAIMENLKQEFEFAPDADQRMHDVEVDPETGRLLH